jgi:putative hydrolase of the HAD superfamily
MLDTWSVHTLVFDVDDTLYPERDYVLSGFKAVDAWLAARQNVSGFYACAERLFSAGCRGRIFDEVLAELGRSEAPEWAPGMLAVYRAHKPTIALTEEAVDILAWSKQRFQLALISDGYLDVQREKAVALGLSGWIACQVFSDEWGREAWKPSERPFREVMARLPGEPSGYVYVADNPRKDFIAPRRLGWKTIRFQRTGGEHSDYKARPEEAADRDIVSLRQLKEILTLALTP